MNRTPPARQILSEARMHAVRAGMRAEAKSDSPMTARARWALTVLESKVRITTERSDEQCNASR